MAKTSWQRHGKNIKNRRRECKKQKLLKRAEVKMESGEAIDNFAVVECQGKTITGDKVQYEASFIR